MSSQTPKSGPDIVPQEQIASSGEKFDTTSTASHLDKVESDPTALGNLVYTDEDEEPEIHFRTWIAYGSMLLLIYCQNMSLSGPPSVLSFIAADLHNTTAAYWVPNALVLVQATMGPIMCLASDTFQARKTLLIGSCLISMIGSGIAPGSQTIYRLIAAQALIGFGFAGVPLTYTVPSEILPRKWRPMAQGLLSLAASMANISGPLIGGALITQNAQNGSVSNSGWRKYFWIEFAIWGVGALGVFFGYKPPKRHTRLDHLSFWQKLGFLDLPGCGLLVTGLVLLLVGLNLGGNLYPWTSATVLVTLILGIVILGAFGAWEWKGTNSGIMSHELFNGPNHRGRAFSIYVTLMLIEGIVLFTFIIFYPVMTTALFTTGALASTARLMPYWVAYAISTPIYGYFSTKTRLIREPLAFGFVLFTAGVAGLATIEPGQSFNQLAFAALAGFGFGAPIVLIISGVQLNVPHHLFATATAVINSARAVGATVFTSIYGAALTKNLGDKIPRYLAQAAAKAGLPETSIPDFVGALASGNIAGLSDIPGVNQGVIAAGGAALKQAYADSLHTVFIIGAPFGAVAVILCFFLSSYKKMMSYRVEAPVEELHAKHHEGGLGSKLGLDRSVPWSRLPWGDGAAEDSVDSLEI